MPDLACVLRVGVHPFIRWDSFILYRKAEQTTVGSLHAKVARGDVLPQQAAARALMQKIREGAYLSEYAAGWLRDAVRDCPWG